MMLAYTIVLFYLLVGRMGRASSTDVGWFKEAFGYANSFIDEPLKPAIKAPIPHF